MMTESNSSPSRLAATRPNVFAATISSLARVCGSVSSAFTQALGKGRGEQPLDALENRAMMAVQIITAVPDSTVASGAAANTISLNARYDDATLNSTIVRFASDLGNINVLLYDNANPGVTRTTPLTVDNFLRYVNANRYTDTIIHRSVPGFVIQGGGFNRPTVDNGAAATVTTFSQVTNEPGNTNARGTIAMAKLGGQPNSATSQWFFNLGNNASNLDAQNGGFTVFGRVINGLNVMDQIAALQTYNRGGALTDVPLRNVGTNEPVNPSDYVGFNISTIPELTYTVTSSNATLVNPTLNGTDLTLSYGAGLSGSATITVRVASADGSIVEDAFTVRVNGAPVLEGFAPSTSQVGRNSPFTLQFANVTDDASVARIDFYRDTNNNGTFDLGTDTLIGSDTSAEGGWNLATGTADFALGTARFFARATDGDGVTSAAVATTINVVNSAPTVSGVTADPNPAQGRVPVTLTATATDSDGAVAFVRFYIDTNRNSVFDVDADALISEDSNSADGFTAIVDTSSFVSGSVRYFAIATDAEGLAGPAGTVIGVINLPLTVGAFAGNPNPVFRRAQTTLTASEIFIPAGKTFRSIEFYADTNRNGTFEEGVDRRIGSSSRLTNGLATVRVSTNSLPTGNNVYFARVQDNLREFSIATAATVTVQNNVPTVRSMRASPTVSKNLGDTVQLSVSGQRDIDGKITAVRYYRDTGAEEIAPDGTFNPETDTFLGEITSSSGGFRLSMSSGSFAIGVNRFFALVVDTDGATSSVVTTTNVINAAPSITAFNVTPDAGPRDTAVFSFEATGVGDGDGTVRQLEFFLDQNANGALDSRGDKSLGRARLIGETWVLSVKGRSLPLGTLTLFARATDNTGAFSLVRTDTVTVS